MISAGRPLNGADGYAGEMGHTFVAANGIRCHCGAIGCLETEASRAALVAVTGVPADDLQALAAALADDAARDDTRRRPTPERSPTGRLRSRASSTGRWQRWPPDSATPSTP